MESRHVKKSEKHIQLATVWTEKKLLAVISFLEPNTLRSTIKGESCSLLLQINMVHSKQTRRTEAVLSHRECSIAPHFIVNRVSLGLLYGIGVLQCS